MSDTLGPSVWLSRVASGNVLEYMDAREIYTRHAVEYDELVRDPLAMTGEHTLGW